MKDKNTASEYVSECITEGISNLIDIRKRAEDRIKNIDIELEKISQLRIEKMQLKKILIELGESKQTKKFNVPKLDFDDESDNAKELYKNICDVLDKFGPLTNRELLEKMEISYEDSAQIIRAIKYLGQNEILVRIGDEKKLSPGPKWNR